jgi:hypothetical protein
MSHERLSSIMPITTFARFRSFACKVVLTFAVSLTQCFSLAFGAEPQLSSDGITWDPPQRPACIFEISGEIDRSTIAYVKEQYRSKENYAASQKGKIGSCMFGRPGVWLDSPGGDVESAVAIGRFLREKNIVAIVPVNAHCASACVITLLGGVYRIVTGNIGIHRPYDIGLSASVQDSQNTYAKINTLLSNYFQEMNISRKLLDEMNAVPPDEVRWLDLDEDSAYGISGTDPAWQDYQDSRVAQAIGISKDMLYERRAFAKKSCAQERYFNQRMLCEQRIIRSK